MTSYATASTPEDPAETAAWEQAKRPTTCAVRYPSTDPTARIVHCGLPWRHDGDHAEEDGAPTWPRADQPAWTPETLLPDEDAADQLDQLRDQLAAAEADRDAAYERGVAEGRRQATEGWGAEWAVVMAPGRLPSPVDDVHEARNQLRLAPGRQIAVRPVGTWAAPLVRHRSPYCACGINDAGARFIDPICRLVGPWEAEQTQDGAR